MQASLYIKGLAPCTKSVAESLGKYLLSIIWRLVRKRLSLNRELVMTEVVNKGSLEIWQFCYKNATERSLDKCKTNWYTELKLKGSSSPASAKRLKEGIQLNLHSKSQSAVYQSITVLLCIFVSKWRPSSIGWQSYLGQFLLQIILLTYFQFQNWNRCSLQSYSRWQRKSRCSLRGIRSGRFIVQVSHFLSETNLLAKKFFDCYPKSAKN